MTRQNRFSSKEEYLAQLKKNRKKMLTMRFEIFQKLGNVCRKCGFEDWRALQIDHVNGGGNRERKKYNPYSYYKHILEVDCEGYQLLCANCNQIKRYEKQEFGPSRAGENIQKCFIAPPKFERPDLKGRTRSNNQWL